MASYIWSQIAAISEQASETGDEQLNHSGMNMSENAGGWKSFNMRTVAAATEDLFHFILSEKGRRVRIFLVKDIVNVADSLIEGEAMACNVPDKAKTKNTSKNEVSFFSILCRHLLCGAPYLYGDARAFFISIYDYFVVQPDYCRDLRCEIALWR